MSARTGYRSECLKEGGRIPGCLIFRHGRLIVRRKKGKMKKEFVTGNRVLTILAVLLFLMLFGRDAIRVQAAYGQVSEKEIREEKLIPGKRLMKTLSLSADEVTQIPKYIVEDGTPYVLDEASIVVEETGRSSSEGADVVTTSRRVEHLPDNDLERIEKSIIHEGLSCELLYVVYETAKEDEDGIPIEYSAVCEYGGLNKYSKSYPSAWQAEVWYDAYEIMEEMIIITESGDYKYGEDNIPSGIIKHISGRNRAEDDKVPLPKPEVKKFALKKIVPGEKEEKNDLTGFFLPVGVGVLLTGLLFLLILWFLILTAPLFALKKGEKYRYIGQVRLKETESGYAAYLTERLVNRADLPVFKIKVPEKVRRNSKEKMLKVCCPEGKWITLVCGKEVGFTLERE